MPNSDKELPENSKERLDRALDHAIEETFPTSDPVSVSVTKRGPVDEQRADSASSSQDWRSTAESLAGQAQEALSGAANTAADAARRAYDQGTRYAQAARERYPEAERYYRQGTRAVREQMPESPLLMLLVGVGIGYAVAWAIHSGRDNGDNHVPEYARKDRADPYRRNRHG